MPSTPADDEAWRGNALPLLNEIRHALDRPVSYTHLTLPTNREV